MQSHCVWPRTLIYKEKQMGRPIKRRFFGVYTTAGTATGGESVQTFQVIAKGSNYSQGTTISTAASVIGGTAASGTVTVTVANGAITTATVSVAGNGYTTAPAVTITRATNVAVVGTTYYGNSTTPTVKLATTSGLFVGMVANSSILGSGTISIASIDTANANIVLSANITASISNTPLLWSDRGTGGIVTANLFASTTTANTIQANAWTTTSGVGKQADIVSQRSSRRYRVTNSTETAVARLVAETADVNLAGPSAAGSMTITATDSTGGTYLVKKLESRTACLVRVTGTQFANNEHVSWNITGAVLNTSVKLATND